MKKLAEYFDELSFEKKRKQMEKEIFGKVTEL